jgi:hypothetical protein
MKRLSISRTFPKHHPKHGQPTRFIEKIIAGERMGIAAISDTITLDSSPPAESYLPKVLTMREKKEGKPPRFEEGEKVQLFVWERKPYRSPHVLIAIVEITGVFIIRVKEKKVYVYFPIFEDWIYLPYEGLVELVEKDGFDNIQDFFDWHGEGECYLYSWEKKI